MAFIRERTEEFDQGSAAFARFETELLERMFAVCRVTLRDYVEARDDRNGPTRQDGSIGLHRRERPSTHCGHVLPLAAPHLFGIFILCTG